MVKRYDSDDRIWTFASPKDEYSQPFVSATAMRITIKVETAILLLMKAQDWLHWC